MTNALDALSAWGGRVTTALLNPLFLVQSPAKRIFWGYLFVSLLIAAVVLAARERRRWFLCLYDQLLSPRLWLHPSSLLDMKLMFAKSLARALLFVSWALSSYQVTLGVVRWAYDQWGRAAPTSWSNTEITLCYTVTLFLASDLSRYLLHLMCHRVPLLWQFHQVHHSAEVMTPLTLYRSHPIENLLFITRSVVVTGLTTGIFFYFFSGRAIQYQLLGVNVFGFIFNMFGANLRHSQVWISYGPLVEYILLSPAQHQLHHSDHPRDHGANYGSCLALWDWLGGSLRRASGQPKVQFGVSQAELNHDPHRLTSALIDPLRASLRLMMTYVHGAYVTLTALADRQRRG